MSLEKEILDIKEQMEKLGSDNLNSLLQAYKKALEDVRVEIARLYVQYAIDGKLQLSKQQRYTILKQFEKQLLEHAKTLGHIDLDYTTKILEQVYSESYYQTAYIIDKGLETTISFALLQPEMVKAAISMPIEGEIYSNRIWNNKEKLVKRVRQTIEKAITQGASIDKLARDIKNDFGVSAMESKRLVQTEVARCHTQGTLDIYKSSGVVNKIMWSATLDLKTNPEDAALDGKTWLINEPHPKPPLHPNCRCTLIGVPFEGWNPTKRKDNHTKEIIDYSTYENWKESRNLTN